MYCMIADHQVAGPCVYVCVVVLIVLCMVFYSVQVHRVRLYPHHKYNATGVHIQIFTCIWFVLEASKD